MKLKLCAAILTAAALFAPLSSVAENAPMAQDPAAKRAAAEAYGKLPLSFEPTASAAHFLARSGSYSVLIGPGQSSVAVSNSKLGKQQTLRFAFDHANPAAKIEALEPLPGLTNYYLGSDPAQWRLGVHSYARLRSTGVYPGVDVVYYGDHRRLEFDFVVAPNADPAAIALSFTGMDKFYKDANGDLVAEVADQPVRFAKPYAYQKVDGATRPVVAGYELSADGKAHLSLGDYDRARELIVDPVVSYATYLGGSALDVGNAIAVDSNGDAYVTGQSCSSNFPETTVPVPTVNPPGSANSGLCDAYVTEFNPTGSSVLYTTFIGGNTPVNATAVGNGIALDSAGNVYVTGMTNISNLAPALNVNYANGLNTYQGGDSDAFIAVLNTSGALTKFSYLGGSGADAGYGIAVDTATPPNVIVVGQTCSNNFPGYNAFETKIEFCVAFVTKLDNGLHIGQEPNNGASAMTPMATGGTPPYYFSEFFGGQPVAPYPTASWAANTYFPLHAIIEDNEATGNIQIVTTPGISGSSMGTPTTSPINPWNGSVNGITNDGSITWTCLGPALVRPPMASSQANGVALDPQGDVFVAGGTDTASLTAYIGPFGPYSQRDGTGAWVLKVSGLNGAWRYGSALETTPSDSSATVDTARAIAVDASGDAYVAGTASGTVFTSGTAYQPGNSGGTDAFLVKMNNPGASIVYSTYLGGSGNDQGLGVAVDGSGAAYVTGSTQSANFPTINPLTDPNSAPVADAPILTLKGQQNAFISKFTADGSALLFSAYLGGSGSDQGNAIALDTGNAGNMYVAGSTSSSDFALNLDPSTYAPPQTAYGGGDSDAFVAMVAGASLPTVTITPGSLNFGPEDVGSTSAPVAVQYMNTNATSTVTIDSIAFGGVPGDFAQVFPGTPPGDCAPGVLAPSTFCNIWVVFTPGPGLQNRSGTLTITDDASSKPHVLSLTGTGEVPQDSFTPTSLTFAASAPQIIGTSSTQAVTLKNTGQGSLDIGSIGITGTDASDFSQVNTCQSQLASGASCTISVTFTPNQSGTLNAFLTVTDNSPGSPHNLSLQGTGAQVEMPTITPASLTLSFGNQDVSVTSAALTVTVANVDPASTLVLTTPVVTGAFQIAPSGTCGASLQPGHSCVIAVTFTPTAAGPFSGTLTFSTNASSSPIVVQLSGTGVASGGGGSSAIQLSPATVPFGSVQIGASPSPSQTVTVTNTPATTPLALTSIAVVGTSDFAITANNCPSSPATLAAGSSCQVTVSFTPSVAKAETATLTVTGAASNSPQSVTLSGTGTTSTVPPTEPDFNLDPSTGGESVIQGSTATFTVTVPPQNNFAGTIAFTCAGPAGVTGYTCTVTPNTLTMDGATTKTINVYVATNGGSGNSAASVTPQLVPRSIFLALLPFSMMGMLLVGGNKRRGMWMLLMLVLLCLLLGMVGCGSSSSGRAGLAPGSYQFTVTGIASGGSTPQTEAVTLQVVVNSQ